MVGVSAAIFSSIYILRRDNLNYFSDHSNNAFAQCRKTDEQKVARIRFWPEICHFALMDNVILLQLPWINVRWTNWWWLLAVDVSDLVILFSLTHGD